MLSLFKYTTTPLIGLDVSSSAVKILELSKKDNRYTVETYGVELLPPNSVVEKAIKEPAQISNTIRSLANRLNVSGKLVATAVSGTSVITRIIQIGAELNEKQIIEQIQLEADRYIPYPLEEVYYDFEVVGVYEKNPEFVNVSLAAARIETVSEKRTVVADAGLKATIIDVESLAIEKAFELVVKHLPKSELENNIALIDIGGTNTDLYIFNKLRAVYNRSQAFGGKHLTDEIQRRYGLSEEEAIAAQKYGGLPEDYTEEVLKPFKEAVIQQINRALQVYFSSSEEAQISYIMLAGGVAVLPGIEALVQNKIGIKTFVANPFIDMDVGKNINKNILLDEGPSLMMACGLALRSFSDE